MHAEFQSVNLKRVGLYQDHFGDLNVDRKIMLKWILIKYCIRVWAGFIWHGIGSSGGPL